MTDYELDPEPMVTDPFGIRHPRRAACLLEDVCGFAPRDGYEQDVNKYPGIEVLFSAGAH